MDTINIIIIWAITALISSWVMLIGTTKCANRFGWNTKITKEDNRFLTHTFLILLVPGWNLVRTIKFAINPFKYIHG